MKKGGRAIQNTNELAVSLIDLLEKKKKHSIQEEKLKKMTWGMGIEHETQYFYAPMNDDHIYPLSEIVVIATQVPAQELLEYGYTLKQSQKKLLENIPYEETGRQCSGVIVLDKLMFEYNDEIQPLRMPEFVTEDPFSTLKNKKTIVDYLYQLIEKEIEFRNLITRVPDVSEFLEKYKLNIVQYPFGMSSNIRVRKDYKSINPDLEKKHYQDYTGSFHFTITLPHELKENYTQKDEKEFSTKHYNFGAMLQWIEPLLLAAYFSCDQEALGTNEKRIRGSFRVGRVGWGNFAGSDMRQPEKGVGRYADVEPYWRKKFDFFESDITMSCYPPNYKLKNGENEFGQKRTMQAYKGVSSFSSNIRSFGPSAVNPKDRVSGNPMKIPNGLEIRIFDHFPSLSLLSLLQIIILIAANSETVKVNDFVYEDEDWINTMQRIMLEGWKADIGDLFLKKLEKVMDIETKPVSKMAWDVLNDVVLRLFEKNKNSDIVYLMYGKLELPSVPMINKFSWDFAFMIKLLDRKTFANYVKFVDAIIDNNKVSEFQKLVPKYFGKNWENNWLDILYFFKEKELIYLLKNNTEYEINPKYLRDFLSIDAIKQEIMIQINFSDYIASCAEDDKKIKNRFFSWDAIKRRYKNYINLDCSDKMLKVFKN